MLLEADLRLGQPGDVDELVRIYNEGIDDRVATFETAPRTRADVVAWFDNGLTVWVVESESGLAGYAVAFPYSPRACYAGIVEASVYLSRADRGRGVGRRLLAALLDALTEQGRHKVLAKIFPENSASLRLFMQFDFYTVGLHRSHAKLDGVWRDVALLEKVITENIS